MKKKLFLTSPIPPSVNHYLAYRATINRGKPLATSYKTSAALKYQKNFTEYVRSETKKQKWIKDENNFQHYYMDTVFYFPRVDMDANNYFKCMADAITDSGTVWIDDCQLCERVQGIFYDTENPRVEITITRVDYIGVFENTSHLKKIQNRCVGCKRYSRNCSIFQKAKEGRIQKELKDGVCISYTPKIEKED